MIVVPSGSRTVAMLSMIMNAKVAVTYHQNTAFRKRSARRIGKSTIFQSKAKRLSVCALMVHGGYARNAQTSNQGS